MSLSWSHCWSQAPRAHSSRLMLSPQLCSQRAALLPTRTLQSVEVYPAPYPAPLLWGSDFPLGFTKSQWFFNLNGCQTCLMGLLRHSASPAQEFPIQWVLSLQWKNLHF